MEYVTIPKFILAALQQCIDAGCVPSIRKGQGGNSHSTWVIKFSVRVDHEDRMSEYHVFEVKVTSSYSQQFLEFVFCAPHADGNNYLSMGDCVRAAKDRILAQQIEL